MERVVAFVLLVIAALLGGAGASRFREMHVDWLFITLVILATLRVVFAFFDVCRGRQRLARGVQFLAASALTIAATTWFHSYAHTTWNVASATGLVLFIVLTSIFLGSSTQGDIALRRANAALTANPPKVSQALLALQQAEAAWGAEASMIQKALFEYLSAIAQGRLGNVSRASAHASEALALYQALNLAKDAAAVTTLSRQMNLKITPLPVGGSYRTRKGGYSWGTAISGVLSVAAVLFLFSAWAQPEVVPSIQILTGLGILLGIWFLALPWFASRSRGAGFGLVMFSIALAGTGASLAAEAIQSRTISVTAFGGAARAHLQVFSDWFNSAPPWTPLAALGFFVVLTLVSIVTGRDTPDKALARAAVELAAERWDRAIAVLGALRIEREQDHVVKGKALFCLAFAQRMSGEQARAQEPLDRLLEFSPEHRDGLYLAGYIALETGDLDRAESLWSRLCAIDPACSPVSGDAHRSAAYYLSATLYRKAAKLKDQPDAEAEILSRISQLGTMDKGLAKTLIGAHCRRGAEFLQRKQWQAAGSEFETAGRKFASLDQVDRDDKETRKLQAICEAGYGVTELKRESPAAAQKAFQHARELISGMIEDGRIFGGEDDLLAQLLRAAQRKRSDANSVDPAFARDISFLAGIAQLNALRLQLGQHGKADWKSTLAVVQRSFEESLEVSPTFPEGAALLGLLYCYIGGPADRAKGLELLKRAQERVSTEFVSETIKSQESAEQSRSEARDMYFHVFQEYLRSTTVPRQERQRMQDEMISRMKNMGQDKVFIGRGSIEMDEDREQEPTVTEYVTRAAMLQEKLKKLDPGGSGTVNDELQNLAQELRTKTQELQDHARRVIDTQREFMKKAQTLLFD